MSLVCPECESQSFSVVDSVECGPGQFADESTIQRAYCAECDTCFLCTYTESRSFNPDRDDKVTHLAFVANRGLWEGSAGIFQTPSSKISSRTRITLAMRVLTETRDHGVTGKTIAYSRASVQEQKPLSDPVENSHPANSGIAAWFDKLLGVFRTER
ncbi:MAG: hypothetical protein AAF299_12165 [Pseudomonadota bacterium]